MLRNHDTPASFSTWGIMVFQDTAAGPEDPGHADVATGRGVLSRPSLIRVLFAFVRLA
ncbi:hypothetical protein BN988_03671 [Oceanobacillus picturae]|uniref:Uncharacterized protein n=1 Tax=Oceanobacillus picturae TaxID=171693 RepID=W9BFH4_9BACI|nr:hypothetical protein BN988_03671 [Oceanobacillus picturae]